MGQNFSEAPGVIVSAFSSNVPPNFAGASDDASDGFTIGSVWIDTAADIVYTCVDNTPGAAVWVSGGGPATAIRETGGPTVLTIGAVNDGQFLRRVGTLLIGGSAPSNPPRYGVVQSPGSTTGTYNTVHIVLALGSDETLSLPESPQLNSPGSVVIVKRNAASDSAVIVRPPIAGLVHVIDGVAGKQIHLVEPEETLSLVIVSYPPGGPVSWETIALESFSQNKTVYLTASAPSEMQFGLTYVFDMVTSTGSLTATLPAITQYNVGKRIAVKRVNSGVANANSLIISRSGTDRIDYVNVPSRTIDGDDAHLIFQSSINGGINSWIVE